MIRFRAPLASAALALALCACAPGAGSLGPAPLTPTSRWALQVEEGLDRIALAVHDTGLSPNQRAALSALAGRFAAAQGDVVVIQGPSGDDPVSAEAAWSTRAALLDMGVPAATGETNAAEAFRLLAEAIADALAAAPNKPAPKIVFE